MDCQSGTVCGFSSHKLSGEAFLAVTQWIPTLLQKRDPPSNKATDLGSAQLQRFFKVY